LSSREEDEEKLVIHGYRRFSFAHDHQIPSLSSIFNDDGDS